MPKWVMGALVLAAGTVSASAADAPSQAQPTIRAIGIFDVSKDLTISLVEGFFAPNKTIEDSGPRVAITGSAGWYQFGTMGETIRDFFSAGDVLAGYGFAEQNYEINLLAGLSAENDVVSPPDPTDRVVGTAVGVMVRADAWINPTPQALLYGEAEYTTAFETYWTSAKFGYDLFGKQIFIGPELTAFGDERSSQWRIGGHITQLKFGKVEVDISAGYAHDSLVGDGAYGHLELTTEF